MFPNVIMLGDFNIHIDNDSNASTSEFLSCLDSFGLRQFAFLLTLKDIPLISFVALV